MRKIGAVAELRQSEKMVKEKEERERKNEVFLPMRS